MTNDADVEDVAWHFHPDHHRWTAAGFTAAQSRAIADKIGPRDAGDWQRAAGPEAVVGWVSVGVVTSNAAGYQQCDGITPDTLRDAWADYRFTPTEAASWIEAWFSPREAAAWRDETGLPAGIARKWRAVGKSPFQAQLWAALGLLRRPDIAHLFHTVPATAVERIVADVADRDDITAWADAIDRWKNTARP